MSVLSQFSGIIAAAITSTPAGNIAATTVQAALNELDAEKTQITTLAAVGGAALVGNTASGTIAATTVQAALNELDTEKAALAGAAFTGAVSVPDAVYDATGWNGSVEVPTKNAVRDKIESLVSTDKIQPITATAAAGALTITLLPTTLDYRSATLGSGAVTTVSNAANITTVISSGSTAGGTSGVPLRLVILAINVAGVSEVAWTNLAGGINLDETGVITTVAEGGAGAADSANVIYLTTARAGVAYRVVGFLDVTNVTAGTWLAPTTIQGAGGQALTATPIATKTINDTTDIVLVGASTTAQNLVGAAFSANIPLSGNIALTSFAGRILNNGAATAHLTVFGIRIATVNYWFAAGNIAPTTIISSYFNTGAVASTVTDYNGANQDSTVNAILQPILDIEANAIPTGLQTIQAIAGFITTTSTLRGTLKTTRLKITILAASS